jgi:hypothetical protein
MAQTVDQMPAPGGGTHPTRYPWDKWFDGRPWRLTRGTREAVAHLAADFSVNPKAMRTYAYNAARRRNLIIETSIDAGSGVLYVRSVGPRPPVHQPEPGAGE